MAKPRTTDIALEEGLRPRRKISANLSYNASNNNSGSEPPTPCHHRTTSSPTKLEGLPGPSPELLAELLRGSSERVARAPAHRNVSQIISLRYKFPAAMAAAVFSRYRDKIRRRLGGARKVSEPRAGSCASRSLSRWFDACTRGLINPPSDFFAAHFNNFFSLSFSPPPSARNHASSSSYFRSEPTRTRRSRSKSATELVS